MKTVADFIFLGSKITADGDCSHEITQKSSVIFNNVMSVEKWRPKPGSRNTEGTGGRQKQSRNVLDNDRKGRRDDSTWRCLGYLKRSFLVIFPFPTSPFTLSRFVIAFLSRNKRLLISWQQSPSAVIFEPKKIACHCFQWFPIYLPWSEGTRCQILVFWMLSFKPAFSRSSFTHQEAL